MSYLILSVLLWLATVYWLVRKFMRKFGAVAIWGLGAKLIGGMSMGSLYLLYLEQGDTTVLIDMIRQFNETHSASFSQYITALFSPIDPYQGNPRTLFFSRLLSPVGFITRNNYWLLSLFPALFSYWASWSFLSKTVPHFPKIKTLLILCFGFFPTYLFWSSGLLKDTLTNGCLMFIAGLLVEYYHHRQVRLKDLVISSILFFLLFHTRHYLAGILAILTTLIVVGIWIGRFGKWTQVSAAVMILLTGAYCIRFVFIRLRPERFPITFHEVHEQIKAKSTAGSIPFDLEPTWISLISNAPRALWTGLFRPGIWEVYNLFQGLEAGLHLLLLALSAISLPYFRKVSAPSLLIISTILFIMVLATALPLSTPNFGSLSRYRVAYTPFFAFLVAYLPYRRFVLKDL